MEKVEQNRDKVVGSLSFTQYGTLLQVNLSCFAVVDVRYSDAGKGVAYIGRAARSYSGVLHREGDEDQRLG